MNILTPGTFFLVESNLIVLVDSITFQFWNKYNCPKIFSSGNVCSHLVESIIQWKYSYFNFGTDKLKD